MPRRPIVINYNTFDVPCKGCGEREVGCHSKCEKYISWNEKHQKRLELINKNKEEQNKINDFFIDKARERQKFLNLSTQGGRPRNVRRRDD